MVLAPHPDDESLAAAGLIQRAVASGAAVRVIFATDGDNNPWPQRFLERRWRIGAGGQRRWGMRRRTEALAALQCLGVNGHAVHFLGWPDQGSTASLLRGDEEPLRVLAGEIEGWKPTLVVAPSIHDVHPDHNALAVQLRLSLATATHRPALLHYLVHRPSHLPQRRSILKLSADELTAKRAAILCHQTQMALSRRRFLAYATGAEQFFTHDDAPQGHPVQALEMEAGALCVRLRPGRFAPGRLHVAFESLVEDCIRWSIDLPRTSGLAAIRHSVTGDYIRRATVRAGNQSLKIRLPLAPVLEISRIFVKYDRSLAFYDVAGWREIPLANPAPHPCPVPSLSAISPSSPSFAPSSFGGASAGLA